MALTEQMLQNLNKHEKEKDESFEEMNALEMKDILSIEEYIQNIKYARHLRANNNKATLFSSLMITKKRH